MGSPTTAVFVVFIGLLLLHLASKNRLVELWRVLFGTVTPDETPEPDALTSSRTVLRDYGILRGISAL